MARTAGIDLGNDTGWALCDGLTVSSGTWHLAKSNKAERQGDRFCRFSERLESLLPLDRVVYEVVKDHSSFIPGRGRVFHVEQAHNYGGYLALLLRFAIVNGVSVDCVPVGTLKKHATGKGNAKKPDMIAAANARLGMALEAKDDDEADARWLLDIALIRAGEKELTTLGRYHRVGDPPPWTDPEGGETAAGRRRRKKLDATDGCELRDMINRLRAGKVA